MIAGEQLCSRVLPQNLTSPETRSRAGSYQPNGVTHCFLQPKPASDRCDIDYLDEDGFSLTGLHWGPSRNPHTSTTKAESATPDTDEPRIRCTKSSLVEKREDKLGSIGVLDS